MAAIRSKRDQPDVPTVTNQVAQKDCGALERAYNGVSLAHDLLADSVRRLSELYERLTGCEYQVKQNEDRDQVPSGTLAQLEHEITQLAGLIKEHGELVRALDEIL